MLRSILERNVSVLWALEGSNDRWGHTDIPWGGSYGDDAADVSASSGIDPSWEPEGDIIGEGD